MNIHHKRLFSGESNATAMKLRTPKYRNAALLKMLSPPPIQRQKPQRHAQEVFGVIVFY
jgi:hypothetical protein